MAKIVFSDGRNKIQATGTEYNQFRVYVAAKRRWYGPYEPHEALRMYSSARQRSGPEAKNSPR